VKFLKIVARGAEAVLSREKRDGEEVIVKERIVKGYRIPQLDAPLRRERTRHEARLLDAARRASIPVPLVLETDEKSSKIFMEHIEGTRLKELINSDIDDKQRGALAEDIGKTTGKLHAAGIVHGDLTTSNMILRDNKIHLIDFGLGQWSVRPEDRGTDLAVLKEAFQSTHFRFFDLLWDRFIKGYQKSTPDANRTITALAAIERRARYTQRCD
jgi:Kae1-associated kinase Bud32